MECKVKPLWAGLNMLLKIPNSKKHPKQEVPLYWMDFKKLIKDILR